jgi:mono/diheme cytochrome c family protein
MKRKIFKTVLIVVLAFIVLVACAATYIVTFLPNTGKPGELTIERTPERIERGKYLANNVAACMDCHSARDYTLYAAPVKDGAFGGGGDRFDQSMGFPGVFYSRNLTPYALSNWTDGELFRAITTGVSKDGSPLFPMMPYQNYGKIDKEDVYSIIAYIRTLQPIKTDVPKPEPAFPFNIIMHTMPAKASFTQRPSPSDTLNYGKYLVQVASCGECHNNGDKGEFAGGNEFQEPSGILRVANITPDNETGIGTWTKETFVQRFKMYADSSYQPRKMGTDEVNTLMPWMMYKGMQQSDLEAIYAYLRTVKPVHNSIVKFEKKSNTVAKN